MNIRKIIGAMALLLLSGALWAQAEKGFILKGNVSGLGSGKQIYLVNHNFKTNRLDTIARTVSSDGEFSLKGSVAYPQQCYLFVQGIKTDLTVFVENTGISVSGNIEAPDAVVVTGSESQTEMDNYNKQHAAIMSRKPLLAAEYQKAKDAGDEVGAEAAFKKFEAMDAEARRFALTFVANNPKSYVSALILLKNFNNKNPEETNALYNKFSEAVKQSSAAWAIKKRLNIWATTSVGKQAPLFSGKDPEGRPIALNDLLKKGKYTMIDFWASWCKPCRAENPNVTKLYKQYHAMGLNILGVSLDANAVAWKKAIADDGLIWEHISDLKGWGSDYAVLYGIQSVPATFLLDANGKIVGKNLQGEELTTRLKELFGN